MLHLCQQVWPGDRLEEFVRSFIMHAIQQGEPEIATVATHCVTDLNVNAHPMDLPSAGEELVPVTVLLIDHSIRRVHVLRSSTLLQLKEKVAQTLRISAVEEYAFFQMTDGIETHRLLHDSMSLASLEQKWAKLKVTTSRASHLLFKRQFLSVEEKLNPGDLIHATLTYRQVLWDFLHYPVPEEEKSVCAVAAAILNVEWDHYKGYIEQGRLDDPGVLEQLVPEVSLRDRKLRRWSSKILLASQNIGKDPGEPRLLGMSRVLEFAQRMKLFGSYFWLGREISSESIPGDKVAIRRAPLLDCSINVSQPGADYYICLDLFGVRFVAADSQAGQCYHRGFLYNEESSGCVLRCEGLKNVLQFVVKAVNKDDPAAGQVPQTISMRCPAAVDVAFCFHTMQAKLAASRDGSLHPTR
eukprot:TRINITY_DN51141_c0_g1_i1.p1 TRINITY_DN51141_c0_g1~~TRINITY_DN51141_c0_g1_i1.p1  ORF type:complete len:412 (-),score=49.79 TRINITY_DN51141_c0_g1_i1:367-1602(-)